MSEFDLTELLPHSGKMLLLDELIDWGEDWLEAAVNIKETSMFVEHGYVNSLVVIEYMAQSIAALAGLRAKNKNEAVRIGLLLGTRKFDSSEVIIPVGSRLLIHVKEMFLEENGLGVFKCKATAPGISIDCNLNVYHPDDIGVILDE
ncbi:MAG: hypothetical protein R3E90_10945 [Marinicella sp.]|nr:hypothetical protein [Xanthomonadales bacterium]